MLAAAWPYAMLAVLGLLAALVLWLTAGRTRKGGDGDRRP